MSLRIQVDKPGGPVYFPGEVLTGTVTATLDGPVACSSIVLTFDGRASILIDSYSSSADHSGGFSHHHTTVYSTTRHILRNEEVYLQMVIHLAQGLTLPPGSSVFPFSVQLPPVNLPCSFEGPHGNVRYIVTARLDQQITSYMHNIMTSLTFVVFPYFDLNQSPLVSQFGPSRTVVETEVGCCSCWAKKVSATVSVPFRAFAPGQLITFEVEIKNDTDDPIGNCTMQLLLVIISLAQGESVPSDKVINTMTGPAVAKKASDTWKVNNFGIPPLPTEVLPPTGLGGGCQVMNVSYMLKFYQPISATHTSELEVNIPILLGTVPLHPPKSSS